MVRKRGQMGPVAQADDNNQGFAKWAQGRPPPPRQGQTIMELKFMTATGKYLRQMTLADFLAPASQGKAINAAKSIFSLAQRVSHLTLKPRAAIQAGLRLSAILLGEMS